MVLLGTVRDRTAKLVGIDGVVGGSLDLIDDGVGRVGFGDAGVRG